MRELAKNSKTRKAAEVALCLHAIQGAGATRRCEALEVLIAQPGGDLEREILTFEVLAALATIKGADAARLHERLKAAQMSTP